METFADQAAVAIANARLIDAVERQRAELSRFLSPKVVELVSSPEGGQLLAGHRAYISCLFCDPSRLHRIRRNSGARRASRGPALVPRDARRADPGVRWHAGALRRRRLDGVLQRSGTRR